MPNLFSAQNNLPSSDRFLTNIGKNDKDYVD